MKPLAYLFLLNLSIQQNGLQLPSLNLNQNLGVDLFYKRKRFSQLIFFKNWKFCIIVETNIWLKFAETLLRKASWKRPSNVLLRLINNAQNMSPNMAAVGNKKYAVKPII